MLKMQKVYVSVIVTVGCMVGCGKYNAQEKNFESPAVSLSKPKNLVQAREGFRTHLLHEEKDNEPVAPPPSDLFDVVQYNSPAGKLAAYISAPTKDNKKHPAIIWIIGGFSNSIGDTPWQPADPTNDQSASAFRKAGIIMMYPSRRGGNLNPGVKEGFYGEVDDVIAAYDYLAKQPFVDPKRIYLGGHSTGGTLALLVSEATDKFRAVFAFGPVDNVGRYGAARLPFDTNNAKELVLRAPGRYLYAIISPTFAFEGNLRGNVDALGKMKSISKNSAFHAFLVENATHFSILAPITPLIAQKILTDTGMDCNITFTQEELNTKISL